MSPARGVASALLFACTATLGCTYVLGLEDDYIVGDDGGAGGGGSSASPDATVGSGGGGSSSTAIGPGGAGSGAPASSSASGSSTASTGSGGAGPITCPSGFGMPMVDVGGYCIDTTEVTNLAYSLFLAMAPDPSAQPSYCTWNTSFTPTSGWPAPSDEANHAVVYVDWCDARAFCEAAGKRLCGKIGGGALGSAEFADPSKSQWTRACSNGGMNPFPYGSAYSGGTCDGTDYAHKDDPIDVGALPACHGDSAPFDEVFDMSGDVAEWEDACATQNGSGDACRPRGGSFADDEGAMGCYDDASESATRSTSSKTIGFRCCAD